MRQLLILPILLLAISTLAQEKLSLKPGYEVVVKGTSTLHDWEMKTEQASGYVTAETSNGKIEKINEVNLTIKAESLKSGKSSMDNNAYEALKTEKNPNITFNSKNVTISGDKIKAQGQLTIAGHTNNTVIEGTCQVLSNGDIKCNGSKKFKMTEYNVDPPTAMFGSIKTGDEVEITFTVTFSN